MDKTAFFGPALKTERAKHHIDELERIFQEFVKHNRKLVVVKTNEKPWARRTVTLGSGFPRHTSTVLGDAIHNLRASLDHAYCILIEANGHTTNRDSSFPFGKDRQSILGTIQRHINSGNGPSNAVRDLILDRIQPFPGGNGEPLYGLHRLDITDKHVVLLPTMTKIGLHHYFFRTPVGGTIDIDATFSTDNPDVQKSGMFVIGAEIKVEPKEKANAVFSIGFKNGQPFERQEVLQTMRDLHVGVKSTLELLRLA